MKYLSVCSGIEAATQAWHPLGWRPVAFSEIEPFPCAVLKHHYPDVPNWGDMTKFQEWPDATVDVLCGGTPCQSFSVAGLRQGLADPRGNLMLTFGAIAARYRPQWLVWENVPGVLSSNGGRDFGAFLGMLGQLGYGVAYRVLDAQHVRTRRFPHAVPQRRRRVFVVGHLGDWRRAAAVLFDRESLSGHPAPRREAGKGFAVSPSLRAQSQSSHRLDREAFVQVCADVAPTMNAHFGEKQGLENQHIDGGAGMFVAQPISFGLSTQQEPKWAENVSPTLARPSISGGGQVTAVAFGMDGAAHCLRAGASKVDKPDSTTYVAAPWAVRRLTPRECERLQGFPDDFTRIPYRGKPADKCPDGPRYKAIGNSWAVNCADWIGERIHEMRAA